MNVLEKKAEIEAMQAELQAEMDRIKEEAERAERIERAKTSSKNMLANAVSQVKTKNHWVKRYAIEAKNVNVVVKKGTTTLTEIARAYINDDYTTVETFTEEVESLSLVYVNPNTKGEYKIDDGWIAHYARKFMSDYPEYEGFFKTRDRAISYHENTIKIRSN